MDIPSNYTKVDTSDLSKIYANRPEDVPVGYTVIPLDDGTFKIGVAPPPDYNDTLDPPPVDGSPPAYIIVTPDDVRGDVYAVMALFSEIAQAMRKSALLSKKTEVLAQVNEMLDSAKKQAEQGDLTMAASIVSAAFTIGGGALALGMSVVGGAKTVKGAKQEQMGAQWAEDAKTASPELQADYQTKSVAFTMDGKLNIAEGGRVQSMAQAINGGLVSGIGQIPSAILTHEGDKRAHDAKEADARAKLHDVAYSEQGEFAQNMLDIIQKINSQKSDLEQTLHQGALAAVHI